MDSNLNLEKARMHANEGSSGHNYGEYATAIYLLISEIKELKEKIQKLEEKNPVYGWETEITKKWRDAS